MISTILILMFISIHAIALMQEKVALDYSYRHLEVECERLKPEVLYLRETLDSATAKVRTLENTINSLERECARVQATNEALREQISDKDLVSEWCGENTCVVC